MSSLKWMVMVSRHDAKVTGAGTVPASTAVCLASIFRAFSLFIITFNVTTTLVFSPKVSRIALNSRRLADYSKKNWPLIN